MLIADNALRGAAMSRVAGRLLALVLLLALGFILGASEEEWLEQHSAICFLDSPSSSFLLAPGTPSSELSGYFSLTYTKPGTVLDTIGINAAPEGAWNMTIDAQGKLSFSIYSPRQRTSSDVGNGWHRYTLPKALRPGQEYNLAVDIDEGSLLMMLFIGDEDAGYIYEDLPCSVANLPVYVGDFPGDDNWGPNYNIHPAYIGDLAILYFGPQTDDLTPDVVARTWVNPDLRLGNLGIVSIDDGMSDGDLLITTEDDTADWNGLPSGSGSSSGGMFTLDFELSNNQSSRPQADCLEALMSASPFYGGAAGGPGVQTGELDALRAAKVREIIDVAADLRRVVGEVEPKLRKLEASYAQMIGDGLQRDPSYEPYVQYTLGELATMKAQAENALAQASKLSTTSGDALADANMQYVSVVHTVKLGGLCLKQADSICLFAALPQGEFQQSGDAQLTQAAQRMEQALAQYDELAPELERIAVMLAQIDCGFKQLEAADYYVGLAGLDFMGGQIPELERQLASASARPGLTAEQLEQARLELRFNKVMYEVMSEQMASMPAPKLIAQAPAQPQPDGADGMIMAAMYVLGPQSAPRRPSLRDIATNMNGFRDIADLPKDPDNPTFGEQLKMAYRRFNNDVNTVLDFKNARKQWGKGVDNVNGFVHKVARNGYGWYYGNSAEEIEKDVEENFQQLAKNQEEGKPGSETYRTAKSYMEGAENLADQAAKDFIEKTFGGKLAPWAAGKIAKGLTSVFTGLAKGIYAVVDPTSTDGEMAVGIAEIALASTAGNAKAYEASLAGFQQMLKTALGLGSAKECLNVVLDQYKEDLGKELLGTGLDGKSLIEAFLNFVGVPPEAFEEFSYDGHYLGSITGAAGGQIAFTIQGTTWQGSVSGSYSWAVEGLDMSGTSEYKGSIYGSFNPETGALSGEVSGTTNGERFSGPISGSLIRDVGGAVVGRGSWQGSDSDDTLSGKWSATRQ